MLVPVVLGDALDLLVDEVLVLVFEEGHGVVVLGFGLDVLTEAEAGYLLRSASVDRIRDRLAKAGGPGVPGRV